MHIYNSVRTYIYIKNKEECIKIAAIYIYIYIKYSIKIAAIEKKLVAKSSDIQPVNDYEEKILYMPRVFFLILWNVG